MAVGGNLIPILRLSSKHKLETITIKIHAGGAGLTLLFCISSLWDPLSAIFPSLMYRMVSHWARYCNRRTVMGNLNL